jgi:hypothetical protein
MASLAQLVNWGAAPFNRSCVTLEKRVVTIDAKELDETFNLSKLANSFR